MTLITGETLLELRHGEQIVPLDNSTELPYKSDVLADVTAELLELRVLLDKTLHVGDRLDRRRVGRERLGLELLDVRCK